MKQKTFHRLFNSIYLFLLIWMAVLSYTFFEELSPSNYGYGFVFWMFHIITMLIVVLLNRIHKWLIHLIFISYFFFLQLQFEIPWAYYILAMISSISLLVMILTWKMKFNMIGAYVGFGISIIWLFLRNDLW